MDFFRKSTNISSTTYSPTTLLNVVKARIQLSGLTCASCVKSIEQTLASLPGVVVSSITVNLLLSNATLQFDTTRITLSHITRAISETGYDVIEANLLKTQSLYIPPKKRFSDLSNLTKKASDDTIVVLEESRKTAIETAVNGIDFKRNINATTMKKEFQEISQSSTIRLTISGMVCGSCVSIIQRTLEGLNSVEYANVNLLTSEASVKYNPYEIGPRDMIQKITELGFNAHVTKTATNQQGNAIRQLAEKEQQRFKNHFVLSLWFAVPTFIIAMIFMNALPHDNRIRQIFMTQMVPGLEIGTFLLFLLATPVQFYLGYPFYVRACKSLYYARAANMDTLVSIGITVAYAGSIVNVCLPVAHGSDQPGQQFFETSVFLVTFIWLGRWMEAKAKGKTYEAITKLMELQPEAATLIELVPHQKSGDNIIETEIDLSLVQVGDILKVNPGARIPCDGKIYRGSTNIDESTLTGESMPVVKGIGDDVFTTTFNTTSSIWIKATRVGADTTLSRIIKLVQEAQSSKKAPIEALADKIAQIFVPLVISIAVLAFVTWFGLGVTGHIPEDWLPDGQNFAVFSLFFSISVLVIACPCAMGLASPTAVMVGTGVVAQFGILIKGGGEAIEMAHRVDVIAFDKTGTLTYGKPKVVETKFLHRPETLEKDNKQREQLLMRIIGMIESSSDHPLAKAVSQYITEQAIIQRNINALSFASFASNPTIIVPKVELELPSSHVSLKEVTEIPGKGLRARIKVSFVPKNFFPDNINTEISDSDSDATSTYYNVYIGNESWMRDNGCVYPWHITTQEGDSVLHKWKSSGFSIVLVGLSLAKAKPQKRGGIILAQFAIADTPRPDAKKTIAALKEKGIEIWMITGDNPLTAAAIALQVGIENVLAEVSPEMKAEKVKWLQRRGAEPKEKKKKNKKQGPTTFRIINDTKSIDIIQPEPTISRLRFWRRFSGNVGPPPHQRATVAMVGDGINDSPALAQSDLPISIASATDVAIESASIVLTRSTLTSLVTLITLSDAVIHRIRMNFLWAYVYNMLAIPIAAGIFFPAFKFALRPEIAGLAMAASSISVVLNSLLLRRFKEPKVSDVE
ncbi:hypothetical protein G9A89_019165 [Geosiphon pyriformis]|nr:hypothetical protein G9A89_019165 [Geosiphon pyriformis]